MIGVLYFKVNNWWVGIRLVFELIFSIRVGEKQLMAGPVYTAAVELLCFEHMFSLEVAHAAAIPVQCVISRELGH